jgi:hypothetical protein
MDWRCGSSGRMLNLKPYRYHLICYFNHRFSTKHMPWLCNTNLTTSLQAPWNKLFPLLTPLILRNSRSHTCTLACLLTETLRSFSSAKPPPSKKAPGAVCFQSATASAWPNTASSVERCVCRCCNALKCSAVCVFELVDATNHLQIGVLSFPFFGSFIYSSKSSSNIIASE